MEIKPIQFFHKTGDTGTPVPTRDVSSSSYAVKPQKILTGMRKNFIHLVVRVAILKIVLKNYKKLSQALRIMKSFKQLRQRVMGGKTIQKVAHVNGKYYWDLYTPGYGSNAFTPFFEGEANRIISLSKKTNRFTNVFVAFTKKCPLQCEHCFEWDALNQKETLSLSGIKEIVQKFQHKGTAQIQLTGGEPLMRVDDIVEIITSAKPETDFWVLTSGYNLTTENAKRLKQAGLTGIVVSLDHVDPEQHNNFRGTKKSFEWVQQGVKNSIDADLLTALSICVTRSFVTWPNLIDYANLAKKMGVSFIQILEPKAIGHYRGMNVALTPEQEKMLNTFYLMMNHDKEYSSYPIVTYHGFHHRQVGCFGSGDRNLYVDTDGDLHACPFCQKKMGNALVGDLDDSIERLQAQGCHMFKGYNDRSTAIQ